MINFDSLTLKLFCEENADFFEGAKIQKIQQPNRYELIFHMRSMGESKKFYVNFNPNFYHVCFMNEQNEKRRNISIPKTAPMFCMLLRKYIQNSKIIKVEVPKYERIFEIYFEYYDELNEKTVLCLAIELMGKHSNVILYNYDTNVIIGCAHNISSEKSRERELYGSLPYVYPPKKKRKNINLVSYESFCKDVDMSDICGSIVKNYNYFTVPIVQNIVSKVQNNSIEKIYKELIDFIKDEDYLPSIKNDYSEFYVHKTSNAFECDTINDMIDDYFSYHQQKLLNNNLKNKLVTYINQQIKKLKTLKAKQQEQIDKIEKANIYKKKADILMANVYYIQSGLKQVTLNDFEGNEIVIDLDENLSPKDNANRFYALYKKSKSANEHAQELIKETDSQILYFEELMYYTDKAQSYPELEDINSELFAQTSEEKIKTLPVEEVVFMGFKIFIGKNKKQNDYILSKISSANDLWFHMLNAPGAHVIVKNNNNSDNIPDKVLLKAAKLVKENSSQKDNSKTCVIYTKRKYVKKANNKLAFVTYKNETEIVV